jgi:hypothetical protein
MASELGVQTIQHTNGTDALTIGSDGAVAGTLTGYVKQVYDSGWVSVVSDTWVDFTHNVELPYSAVILQKVTSGSNDRDSEYQDGDVIQVSAASEIEGYDNTGMHSISRDNVFKLVGQNAIGAYSSTAKGNGYAVRLQTNGTRVLIYKAQ